MNKILSHHTVRWWTKIEHSVWFDAFFYGLSALFAFAASSLSSIPLYREWGQIAQWPYLGAFFIAIVLAKTKKIGTLVRPRIVLALLVIGGAVITPMGLEIAWRFNGQEQALHVQPEVVVIENAASQVVQGHDPYRARMDHGELIGRVPGLPAYEAFFPYLPAMTLFGLPSTAPLPRGIGDARVWFLLATALSVAMALWWLRVGSRRRMRALQVMLVLPWAALTVSTGGDDLPIIGLLLVAVVLTAKKKPLWAGLVLGLVSAMKFTAWPLALFLVLAAKDENDERRPWLMVAGIAGISIPLGMATLVMNPQTFVANVVLFPLGLSGVSSPAGSALPGHIFISLVPSAHRIFPALCAVIGMSYLVWWIKTNKPNTVPAVCRLAGWSLLVAILLAPATRVGYLMYPLNFFVWSWLLTEPHANERDNENVLSSAYSSAA